MLTSDNLENISENEFEQKNSINDYIMDISKKNSELEKKDEIKLKIKHDDNKDFLKNSVSINNKIASISYKKKRSFVFNEYDLYPFKLVKSYSAKDGNSLLIFSRKDFHQISFLNGQNKFGLRSKTKDLEFPSPVYIQYKEYISKIPIINKEILFKGTRKDDNLGLVLVDKEICTKFKGIVGKIIKSFLINMFTRKPLQLPIQIFEPKSRLQRISECWSFGSKFLITANENNMFPIERMKNVMCFAIGGLCLSTRQLKPLDPILGETFQGIIDQNTSVYLEHVSYDPNVTRFLIIDNNKKFRFYGFDDFLTITKNLGSKLIVHQKGPNICEFQNNEMIIYNLPKVIFLNCKNEEERSIHLSGKMIFVDVKNNLKGVVIFGKNKEKVNEIKGSIQRFYFPTNYSFNLENEISLAKKTSIDINVLCRIKGDWLHFLDFDGKINWQIDKLTAIPIIPIEYPLPSDGRYREDLIWLFRSFYSTNYSEKNTSEEYSQNWKLILELTERNDRELRNYSPS